MQCLLKIHPHYQLHLKTFFYVFMSFLLPILQLSPAALTISNLQAARQTQKPHPFPLQRGYFSVVRLLNNELFLTRLQRIQFTF